MCDVYMWSVHVVYERVYMGRRQCTSEKGNSRRLQIAEDPQGTPNSRGPSGDSKQQGTLHVCLISLVLWGKRVRRGYTPKPCALPSETSELMDNTLQLATDIHICSDDDGQLLKSSQLLTLCNPVCYVHIHYTSPD